LKKGTNPLKTNWRDFLTESNIKSSTLNSAAPELDVKSNIPPIETPNVQTVNVRSKVSNSGGQKLPGLGKFHNNSKNVIKRFKKSSENMDKSMEDLYQISQNNSSEFYDMMDTLDDIQRDRVSDFQTGVDYSRINHKPAIPGKLDLSGVRTRRFAITLSRAISKIAEDNVGATTDGDDFWDADRLAMRSINKESLYKCRNSREKHNVLILLDSSPSCSNEAELYSQIASQCTQYGDVELYDAPNARLVHMYDGKKKRFVEFLTVDDIINNLHRWSMFKNRNIIFFGDFDGYRIAFANTFNNKVYYFCSEPEEDCLRRMRRFKNSSIPHNFKNLTMIPNIYDNQSFMEACKKLK